MDIKITGHHLEITPAIREFTAERFSKLLKHYSRISAISVTYSVDHHHHQKAEAHISIPGGEEINAHAESKNLYEAIDLLTDKLDRQLLKQKGKKADHNHHRDHGHTHCCDHDHDHD